MFQTLASAVALTLATAAPVQSNNTFPMECVATPPSNQADLPYGPHEGSQKVHITGLIDTKVGRFSLSTITGTGIARIGWVAINKFDATGPYASASWKGADGLVRFYGIHFDMRSRGFVLMGFTMRGGRKVMEYYSGTCTIS